MRVKCARLTPARLAGPTVLLGAGLLLCAGLSQVPAQKTVLAALDSAEIQTGGVTALRIQVHISPDLPQPYLELDNLDTMSRLEVLRMEPMARKPSRNIAVWEQSILLIAFEPGRQSIPPLAVHTGDSIRLTNPLVLTINPPGLPQDANLAPIKDIVEEKMRWFDWAWLPALASALLGAGLWLAWRWRHRTPAHANDEAELPPHIDALERLQQLKVRKPWDISNKRYYTELTDILRLYISRRFGVPAISETSTGMLEQLSLKDLEAPVKAKLERILHTADLAKFAKADPGSTMNMELLAEAMAFVEATLTQESVNNPAS